MILLETKEVDRVIFHFNKAFLSDPTIPMWVIKYKGDTYYVDHVIATVGFSTKETPDNTHTKGSVLLRGLLLIQQSENRTIAYVKAKD